MAGSTLKDFVLSALDGRAAQPTGMHESDMGEVHQVIGDQLIVSTRHDGSVDGSVALTPDTTEVRNQSLVRLLRIAPPQPHECVALNGFVASQPNAGRNR